MRRDLGLQLLALYLLFVGLVAVIALGFDQIASQRLEADVRAADLALARAIALETDTVIDNALQSVRQLARVPAVIQADSAAMQPLFEALLNARADVNLVYRLDEAGIMLYHYPPGPGSTVGWDFSNRDYFVRALETREALVSLGRISPTTGQPVATAVMPLWGESGEFLGVVATNLKLESLSYTLASIATGYPAEEFFEVLILDSAGQIIAHPSAAMLLTNLQEQLPAPATAALSGSAGSLITANISGRETLFSYTFIPSAGWGVLVGRSTSAAFATPQAIHRVVLTTIAVFFGFGLLFWIALSTRVLRPLVGLAKFSQSIERKEALNPEQQRSLQRISQRQDQVGFLGSSLISMDEAIQARLNELSTLLQTSAAMVSSLDTQTVLDRILEQVERLMGIQRCAIVAQEKDHGQFRARASRGLSHRYVEHLEIDPDEPQSVTLRAIRSGEPIQVSDTETDPTFTALRARSQSEGYRAILAVPLKTQHAPSSALLVYHPEPHQFTENEIGLLTSFANHAAMAIENATLFAHSDTRLQEQTRRLEALIQSLQDGLILEDLQGNILYANRRLSEWVGLPFDALSGMPVVKMAERLIGRADNAAQTRSAIEGALQQRGAQRLALALREPRQNRHLNWTITDVTDAHGSPTGRLHILQDVTQSHELDRMKSSLIATVSHELRTPLAAIKGYTTTLLAEDVHWDAAAQREFLEIVSQETDRLSDLVNDLLDMSRIEAGNLEVTRQECDLGLLAGRAALRAHPRPGERLQLLLPENLPPLHADPQRLEAVLRNLIENAAKYSGDHSPIRVSAAELNGKMIVRVEDEGPGIPAEHSQRIFDSFYRVENGLTRATPGAGLGLAIAQGFVRAHGGEIWLEPRAKGVCVAFSIPMI